VSERRERRYDEYGALVKMAEADGWYLVRRPYKLPGAMSKQEWGRLSSSPIRDEDKADLESKLERWGAGRPGIRRS
jgi:hypothetical protein